MPSASADARNDEAPANLDDDAAESPELRCCAVRAGLIGNLISQLDVVLFAEIAALYYQDNLTFFLLARVLIQHSITVERPEGIPENLQQSQIGCIFGMNLISAVYHLLRPNPSAGEATRGYLHGGLILDFVGQLGPIPKFQLLLFDLAILLLQLLLVRTVASKRHWHNLYQSHGGNLSASNGTAPHDVTLEQQDAEEQGTIPTESHGDESIRPASMKDGFDVDRLNSGQETLGPFWVLDHITEPHHHGHLPSNEPTSTLSSLLSMDLRRRQYSLNLPFGR